MTSNGHLFFRVCLHDATLEGVSLESHSNQNCQAGLYEARACALPADQRQAVKLQRRTLQKETTGLSQSLHEMHQCKLFKTPPREEAQAKASCGKGSNERVCYVLDSSKFDSPDPPNPKDVIYFLSFLALLLVDLVSWSLIAFNRQSSSSKFAYF